MLPSCGFFVHCIELPAICLSPPPCGHWWPLQAFWPKNPPPNHAPTMIRLLQKSSILLCSKLGSSNTIYFSSFICPTKFYALLQSPVAWLCDQFWAKMHWSAKILHCKPMQQQSSREGRSKAVRVAEPCHVFGRRGSRRPAVSRLPCSWCAALEKPELVLVLYFLPVTFPFFAAAGALCPLPLCSQAFLWTLWCNSRFSLVVSLSLVSVVKKKSDIHGLLKSWNDYFATLAASLGVVRVRRLVLWCAAPPGLDSCTQTVVMAIAEAGFF